MLKRRSSSALLCGITRTASAILVRCWNLFAEDQAVPCVHCTTKEFQHDNELLQYHSFHCISHFTRMQFPSLPSQWQLKWFDFPWDWDTFLFSQVFEDYGLKVLTSDHEWPRVTMSDHEWPRVTTSGHKWLRMTTSDNELGDIKKYQWCYYAA